jgi:hypothetical protein
MFTVKSVHGNIYDSDLWTSSESNLVFKQKGKSLFGMQVMLKIESQIILILEP